jgi:hypothetical protein
MQLLTQVPTKPVSLFFAVKKVTRKTPHEGKLDPLESQLRPVELAR